MHIPTQSRQTSVIWFTGVGLPARVALIVTWSSMGVLITVYTSPTSFIECLSCQCVQGQFEGLLSSLDASLTAIFRPQATVATSGAVKLSMQEYGWPWWPFAAPTFVELHAQMARRQSQSRLVLRCPLLRTDHLRTTLINEARLLEKVICQYSIPLPSYLPCIEVSTVVPS